MQRFPFIIPVVLLAFFVTACHKDAAKSNTELVIDPTPGSIIGKWELYQTYSGMSPLTTYAAGNGQELHFDSTTYKIYRNGQLQREGTYTAVNDSVVNVQTCALEAPKSALPNRLIYDGEHVVRNSFIATKNSLTLTTGCIPLDGGFSVYRRLSGGGN